MEEEEGREMMEEEKGRGKAMEEGGRSLENSVPYSASIQ